MDPFPEALEQEYADYLRNVSTNRSLLTSRRRWEMREILNHPTTLAHTLFVGPYGVQLHGVVDVVRSSSLSSIYCSHTLGGSYDLAKPLLPTLFKCWNR
jgi:hypothetical protein